MAGQLVTVSADGLGVGDWGDGSIYRGSFQERLRSLTTQWNAVPRAVGVMYNMRRGGQKDAKLQ